MCIFFLHTKRSPVKRHIIANNIAVQALAGEGQFQLSRMLRILMLLVAPQQLTSSSTSIAQCQLAWRLVHRDSYLQAP